MNTTPQPTYAQVGTLAGRILVDTVQRSAQLLRSAAALPVFANLPARKSCSCGGGCGCAIPETECPTRCIGPIKLGAMTGQPVAAGIRVVNDANEQRHFDFSATPFLSGSSSATFTFSPTQLDIAPGASGFTTATVTIPPDFPQGHYQAEIVSRGAYEQCVLVDLEVGCTQMRSATAKLVQVETPFKITAHCWYHHFQCVEPCGQIKRDAHDQTGLATPTIAGAVNR
jgi:hypothetical protein